MRHSNLLIKPILSGALIALCVISFFVFGVDQAKPEWGRYWMIKPLIMTPLFGAISAAFGYLVNEKMARRFPKILGNFVAILIYIIGLWLGIVLGLNGTMWD